MLAFLKLLLAAMGFYCSSGSQAANPSALSPLPPEKTQLVATVKAELERIKTSGSFGCFAIDAGRVSPLADSEPVKEIFSPQVFFVFYRRQPVDLSKLFVYDWEFLGDEATARGKVNAALYEIPELPGMVIVMPQSELAHGLYSICGGKYSYDYQFNVQVRDQKQYWKEVLAKHPNSWQANNHLGAIVYMEQDYPQARALFQKGVDLNPGNCEVQNNLGLALSASGNLQEALVHFAEAVRIMPNEPSIRANYANALSQAKRYDEAVIQYRESLKLPSPYKAGIYLTLGNALLEDKKSQEAIEAYQEALKLDPKLEDARRKLESARKQLKL